MNDALGSGFVSDATGPGTEKPGLERSLEPGEILVYSEENQRGEELLVTKDISKLDDYFPVASFRLGPKTGVTFFADQDYQGL